AGRRVGARQGRRGLPAPPPTPPRITGSGRRPPATWGGGAGGGGGATPPRPAAPPVRSRPADLAPSASAAPRVKSASAAAADSRSPGPSTAPDGVRRVRAAAIPIHGLRGPTGASDPAASGTPAARRLRAR